MRAKPVTIDSPHSGLNGETFVTLDRVKVNELYDVETPAEPHAREELVKNFMGEAVRNDKDFCHVAAWEFTGVGETPKLHKEPLAFENVELTTRSYK